MRTERELEVRCLKTVEAVRWRRLVCFHVANLLTLRDGWTAGPRIQTFLLRQHQRIIEHEFGWNPMQHPEGVGRNSIASTVRDMMQDPEVNTSPKYRDEKTFGKKITAHMELVIIRS